MRSGVQPRLGYRANAVLSRDIGYHDICLVEVFAERIKRWPPPACHRDVPPVLDKPEGGRSANPGTTTAENDCLLSHGATLA